MEKIEKRILVYLLEIVAYCAIILFGFFYGAQHPEIFFWGLMATLAVILINEVAQLLRNKDDEDKTMKTLK